MILSDIFVTDSGRPMRNTGAIVTYVTAVGSGSISHRYNDPNSAFGGPGTPAYGNTGTYPSGSMGNTNISPYFARFDDAGYYTSAHSGYVYGGNTVRDVRQTNM